MKEIPLIGSGPIPSTEKAWVGGYILHLTLVITATNVPMKISSHLVHSTCVL